MTVKALLEKYPNAEFDFMSPGGYVYLTAEKARALLAGEPVFAHAGFPDTGISIPAEMLLTQEICFGGWNGNVFSGLTGRVQTPEDEEQIREFEESEGWEMGGIS